MRLRLILFIGCFTVMLIAAFAEAKTDYGKMLEECKKAENSFNIEAKKSAIEYCTKAISIKPQSWEPYQYRGSHYISTEDIENAINDFTRVIELKPSNVEAYSSGFNNRGCVLFMKGQYDEAISDYKKALEIDPNNENAKNNLQKAFNYKNASERIKTYSEKLKTNPNDRQFYNDLAAAYVDKQEHKKAIEVLDACLSTLKDECKLYNFRGWCKLKIGDKKSAYEDFTLAIKKYTNDPEFKEKTKKSYLWRAKTYELEEVDKKIVDIKKALEIDPNYTDALWSLGWAYDTKTVVSAGYQKQQALKDAINAFTRLKEINPDSDVRVYRFLAQWLVSLEHPICEDAIKNQQKAANMENTDQDLSYLAEIYVKCKDYNSAINTYEKMLSRPDSFFTYKYKWQYGIDIAKVYFAKNNIAMDKPYKTGEFKSLKTDLQKVIDYLMNFIQKTPSPCRWNEKTGKFEIKDSASDYLCLNKQEAQGYLGIVYQAIGDSHKAYDTYTKAIETFPLATGIYTRRALLSYHDRKDSRGALADCEESIKQKNSLDKFGNIYCSESFIEHLRQNTTAKKPKGYTQPTQKKELPGKRFDKAW